MEVINRLVEFYTSLSLDSVEKLDQFYSKDIVFIDPAHQLSGILALKSYFADLLQNTQECRFVINAVNQENNTFFLTWCMVYRHKRINRGREVSVEGISKIVIEDDLITHHRDYFDLGIMIYEQLPIVGGLIRGVKGRLAT